MNNEDKRFKQINRIATPIKIDEQGNKIEETKEVVQVAKESARNKKEINPNLVFKILIVILLIGIIFSFLYLLKLDNNNSNLKYNDITTTKAIEELSGFSGLNLSESEYLANGKEYKVGNLFTISINNSNILINGKSVVTGENVLSNIGLVDDLILFTTENGNIRSKTLYAFDKDGKKYLELYHIENGMVISSEKDSIKYSPTGVIIKASNVINDNIYLDNNINQKNPISICNDELLLNYSVLPNTNVISYYTFDYLEDHKFSEINSYYNVTLNDYRLNNNYCN